MPIAKSQGNEDIVSRNFDSNSQNLKLLRSEMAGNLTGGSGGGEIVIEENALMAVTASTEGSDERPKITKAGADEISVYIVRQGDTISQIAEMFGVKSSTIRGFNNIRKDSDLKPGQELLILPIDGVSYKVEKGDTLASVAKKFKSDEMDIALFNDIAEDGKLTVGSEIIIPNAEPLPEPVKAPTKVATKPVAQTSTKSNTQSGNSAPSGFYIHPVPRGAVKSQGFHGPYQAQDLAAKEGTDIVASSGGRVIAVRSVNAWNGGYGGTVIIDDGRANVLYAHMSKISVTQGQVVTQGQKIGEVGNTGRSTGPHLHIEYRGKNGPIKTPVW